MGEGEAASKETTVHSYLLRGARLCWLCLLANLGMLQDRVFSFKIAFHRTSPEGTGSSQAGGSAGILCWSLAWVWAVARAKEMQEILHTSTKAPGLPLPIWPSTPHLSEYSISFQMLTFRNSIVETQSGPTHQFPFMDFYLLYPISLELCLLTGYSLDVLEDAPCSGSTLSSWAATGSVSEAQQPLEDSASTLDSNG